MALDYYTFIKSKLKYCNFQKLVVSFPEYEESGYAEGANFINSEGVKFPLKFTQHGFATFLQGIIGEDTTRVTGEVIFTYNSKEDNIDITVDCSLRFLSISFEEFNEVFE